MNKYCSFQLKEIDYLVPTAAGLKMYETSANQAKNFDISRNLIIKQVRN
jgi:hypothetical protein